MRCTHEYSAPFCICPSAAFHIIMSQTWNRQGCWGCTKITLNGLFGIFMHQNSLLCNDVTKIVNNGADSWYVWKPPYKGMQVHVAVFQQLYSNSYFHFKYYCIILQISWNNYLTTKAARWKGIDFRHKKVTSLLFKTEITPGKCKAAQHEHLTWTWVRKRNQWYLKGTSYVASNKR